MKVIFISLLLVLGGCRLGPTYHAPQMAAPQQWKSPEECSEELPNVAHWWQLFQDPYLEQLEEDALAHNKGLRMALQRVIEARAVAGISEADLFPNITLNPSYSNTNNLFKLLLPPNLAGPGAGTGAGAPGLFGNNNGNKLVYRVQQLQFSLPITMNYELDLWGKLRAHYDSANMSAQAQAEALSTVLLTLTTDLASHYFALRTLDSQLETMHGLVRAMRDELQLSEARYRKGLIGQADVLQADIQVTNEEASLYDLLRERRQHENAIAVLIGLAAAELSIEPMPLCGEPVKIPALLPSEVILQRPDLRQAEREAAAEHALIGAAFASYFPSIQLTGSLGFFSPDLQEFLTWKSRYSSVGTNVSQVLFDAGKTSSNVSVAWARFHEASYSYQEKVLTAFQEVEDALQGISLQSLQAERLRQSLQTAQDSRELSQQRYSNGLVPYMEVLSSQRGLLEATMNETTVQGARYQSTVQLIKALGGAWNRGN